MTRNGIALVLASCSVASFWTAESVVAQDSRLQNLSLSSELVPSPVDVGVLLPPGYDPTSKSYPLLLLLHGGNGSSVFLEELRPVIEGAWEGERLPAMVVATPSTGPSFYLDYRDGSQRWETFILAELLPRLRETYRVEPGKRTFLAGLSMGGTGALRLAFKDPTGFRAVAALAPALEPGFSFDQIDVFSRHPDSFYWERFGNPIDRDYWEANHPLTIARQNLDALKGSGLALYLEVGDVDGYRLYRSAELLHRLLYDGGFKHEYRLLRGVGHAGESIPRRMADALAFIGGACRSAE